MQRSLLMSSKEDERIQMLEEVKKRKLTIREASELCGISERQFYQIKSSYDKEGIIIGVINKSRERPSNQCCQLKELFL